MDVEVPMPIGLLAFLGLIAALGFVVQFVHFIPVMRRKGDALLIVSSWKHALFGFGFGSRRVSVDPLARTICIQDRRFWLLQSRRSLPFSEIAAIVRRYKDITLLGGGFRVYQATEMYIVGLRLQSGKEIALFRFAGAGRFVNHTGLPNWCFPAIQIGAVLTSGAQESESRRCADALSLMIKVPLES